MNPLYLLGGGIAIALLVYLFVALFKPESFS
ncbi:MAG: K(+)-transporting ATPase subunit F [Bryobacterales bacterium]|nr:K(+)-transporting ATPase subunit F [Bryobacterales bacterium]MCC7342212.1 K(+)-transporting ATPase subunit F [Bryobacterales bacterium]